MHCDVSLTNRVKRAHGQMQGVMSMMDQGAECEAIVNQLKAVRSSIDKVIALLTTSNLIQTIEQSNGIKLDNIQEALDLIVKSKS